MLANAVDSSSLFTPQLAEKDEVLQPSSLRGYRWPVDNPQDVPQPTRLRTAADADLVGRAATVPFDLTRFHENTRGLDVAGRVHFLLTNAKFQFNPVTSVRSEPLWLNRMRRSVAKGEPITLVYPLFCKIGNWAKQMVNIGPTAADEATIYFFRYLNELVRQVYPPGLSLAIVADARLYNSAFQNSAVEVAAYMRAVGELIWRNAGDFVTLFSYDELLAEHAPQAYDAAHRRYQRLMCDDPQSVVRGIHVETLFLSVKASINTRRFSIPYADSRELFSADENPANRFFQMIERMTLLAFEEVIAIRKACAEVDLFERIWPDHVRVTCHKGTKNGRAVIGLRPYPEYYGSSKLLPYHGVPLIGLTGGRVKLDIRPEVLLRGRMELIRVVEANGETYFYDGRATTPSAAA